MCHARVLQRYKEHKLALDEVRDNSWSRRPSISRTEINGRADKIGDI